jgi:lipopolysaccharide biosynthesis glycosyltransferase
MTNAARAPADTGGRRAICYLTDEGYLLPSLVSALSCLPHVGHDDDIFVFCIGLSPHRLAELKKAQHTSRINIRNLSPEWKGRYDEADFRSCGVTDVTLGRYFMVAQLDPTYKTILYIDGDTLVGGDIKRVLDICPPAKRIGAVADSIYFSRCHESRLGEDTRRYFDSIDQSGYYYNGGVLVGSREAWEDLSLVAFEFFVRNVRLCHHHDQTALNVTYRDYIQPLSIRCNYQPNYEYFQSRRASDVIVNHYCGPVKPWRETAWPLAQHSRRYRTFNRQLEAIFGFGIGTPRSAPYRTVRQIAKFLRFRALDMAAYTSTSKEIDEYERLAFQP